MTEESKSREIQVHLPVPLIEDLERLGKGLGLEAAAVLSLAWELGKESLSAETPGVNEEGQEVVGKPIAPPLLPEGIEAEAAPGDPPPLAEAGEKKRMSLSLSARAAKEIEELAFFADRSMSWCVHQAFLRARANLWARIGLP